MELAQGVAQAAQVDGLALLSTALVLGIRHGIDWDHIAAITDITSTTTNGQATAPDPSAGGSVGSGTFGGPSVARGAVFSRSSVAVPAPPGGTPTSSGVVALTANAVALPTLGGFPGGRVEVRALWLASLYALGHAGVVVLLGIAALSFQAILPEWVDPIMERIVGVTLLALGVWVAYSLVQHWRGKGEFRLRSRWMLVFSGVRQGWRALRDSLHGYHHDHRSAAAGVDQYGPGTAFGVGVIHGIGAETGTQVLIIAAVGGAASQGLGVMMLVAFVAGLLLSNTLVAALSSLGFLSASRTRNLYLAVGCLTAVFSLVVGTCFLLGWSDRLPDLQPLTSFLGGASS
jgi:hypothetical protein